jgi:hypothetical protein
MHEKITVITYARKQGMSNNCMIKLTFQELQNSHVFSYLWLGTATVQAVSHWPLTAETRVRIRVSPCGICGAESRTGTGSPPSFFRLSPANIIPPWLSMFIYRVIKK